MNFPNRSNYTTEADALQYFADVRTWQIKTCLIGSPLPVVDRGGKRHSTYWNTTILVLDGSMLEAYRGLGSGVAYISEGELVAWHYGKTRIPNPILDACEIQLVSLSCTEMIFDGGTIEGEYDYETLDEING